MTLSFTSMSKIYVCVEYLQCNLSSLNIYNITMSEFLGCLGRHNVWQYSTDFSPLVDYLED